MIALQLLGIIMKHWKRKKHKKTSEIIPKYKDSRLLCVLSNQLTANSWQPFIFHWKKYLCKSSTGNPHFMVFNTSPSLEEKR